MRRRAGRRWSEIVGEDAEQAPRAVAAAETAASVHVRDHRGGRRQAAQVFFREVAAPGQATEHFSGQEWRGRFISLPRQGSPLKLMSF
jgi:hypothetical protein